MKRILYLCIMVLLVLSCSRQPENVTLVILSTTDTHSQVESLPKADSRYPDLGGYARRMGLVEAERKANPNVLLFDSGDFSQGTPYFNFFHGRVEIDAMNRMRYDAVTLGNHEFDNGLDTLAMLLRMAQFPIVCSNYDVTGTPLDGLVKPYVVIERGGARVGVLGLGVVDKDLISKKNFGGIRYLNPLECVNSVAATLRSEEHCDIVVCLSHLGSTGKGVQGYENDRDTTLIPMVHSVDIFLSGHSHQLLNERLDDADGKSLALVQSGKAGAYVGKSVVSLE